MKRRNFLRTAGLAGGAAALAACKPQGPATSTTAAASDEVREWKMVTAWPKNFPGLGTAANEVAAAITAMSGGRLTVKVYGANDLVPAFEVFDTVSSGTAEMGHAGAYYWKGKAPAAQFFASVPFGMTTLEVNGWLHFGGGMELWRKVYEPFNLIPFAAGNSTTQMGGWFNRKIETMEDLKGLKMRIPGLGGEVLERAGGVPVSLPGGEVYTSLESGAIDATEWVGPYNDRAFGLQNAATYYYYPGWHEPSTVLECMVNKDAFNGLPADLQAIVEHACHSANDRICAEYTARNAEALEAIRSNGKTELLRFPDEVLDGLQKLSIEVIEDAAKGDALTREIIESYNAFLKRSGQWMRIADQAFLTARTR